jgi:hypothetical protein
MNRLLTNRFGADSFGDARHLQAYLEQALQPYLGTQPPWEDGNPIRNNLSVVMLLVGMQRAYPDRPAEPCVIFNKRSGRVPQPGDICCPGGGIAPRVDRLGARLLQLPNSPLRRWDGYRQWKNRAPHSVSRLSLLLATALREGMEEMRLNPLGVNFLGALAPEHLVMFKRVIYPMVGWVRRQQRFFPNWEVERIVTVPLRELLIPENYLRLRLITAPGGDQDFPAFRHQAPAGKEILWGATFRITMNFLRAAFGFIPPAATKGAVVEKHLGADYLTGKG